MAQPSITHLEFIFLGESYKLSCPQEDKAKLEKAAELLQNQFERLEAKGIAKEKQAIMAALFLSYDYLAEREELVEVIDELKLLRDMVMNIDQSSSRVVSVTS